MTEGLQIPAAARILTGQSLSQPDGCQLPLHKGAEGAERMCGASPVALAERCRNGITMVCDGR